MYEKLLEKVDFNALIPNASRLPTPGTQHHFQYGGEDLSRLYLIPLSTTIEQI